MFASAPHTWESHRCASVHPPPGSEQGPQNVDTRDRQPHEEEMTHHRLRQQPPRPRSDQRAPPQGGTGGWGAQQQAQAPPPLEAFSPPKPPSPDGRTKYGMPSACSM